LEYIENKPSIREHLEELIDAETKVEGDCCDEAHQTHLVKDSQHLAKLFRAAGNSQGFGRIIIGDLR
jgi:hypothetical protein